MTSLQSSRHTMGAILFCTLIILLPACDDEQESQPESRSYKMGFQNSAPRFDNFDLVIQSLNMWTARADAAIISTEVPWKELLNGTSPIDFVSTNYRDLASYYRTKNFELWVYIDPQNGLDRASDATALVDAGKSITDPEMQQLYRRFTIVMDSVLNPEHLGLALETNLIRAASSPALYNGVRQAVNDAANDILLSGSDVKLSISVQAEMAWGKFGDSVYQGIDQDLADFPFVEELGISSYPYFGFDKPDDIPIDYYSKMVENKDLQVFITEGGWSSASVTTDARTFSSTPQLQADYIQRHKQLLNEAHATAYFQLTFTDIDIASLPDDVPDNLSYFAFLGLVDTELQSKPALAVWDEVFALPRK